MIPDTRQDDNALFRTLEAARGAHITGHLSSSKQLSSHPVQQIAAELDEVFASLPLTPYLVFNTAGSPQASGMPWLNRGKVAFVARLCHAFFDIVGVDL